MQAKHALAKVVCGGALAALGLLAAYDALAGDSGAFIPRLVNTSTIPANGDVNPYGVAFVPAGFPAGGTIGPGDVVVSNFNGVTAGGNPAGTQGTGTTIISFPAAGPLASPGNATVFFTSKLTGLSTALGVLRGGFVVVGNVPTTDGTVATIGQGSLQVIGRSGNLVQTFTDATFLDGPWDLTIDDDFASARIFVSNVLNGSVSRLDVTVVPTGPHAGLHVSKMTTIAQGYTVQPSSAAVILGPTGLAFDKANDILYVASTAENTIFAVPHAGTATAPDKARPKGSAVFADPHLIGPLALRFAPNGNLLTANGDATSNADTTHPSEIIEFTVSGKFVREFNVDSSQGGAFGLDARNAGDGGFNFTFVDDVTNNLSVYRLPTDE